MTRTVHRLITTLLAGTALTTPLAVAAGELPTGASVVHGSVGIALPGANAMAIQQSSQTAIVNWQTFSIGQGARVDITQPNASAALLSRVNGSTPSTIAGQLNANGQVYLVNPNGIVITSSGVVRAGGFVGSTLGISDEDFKAGRRAFKGNGASATVSNQGTLDIAQGGYAALLGGRVENAGVVSVPLGRVGFGAGERATLDLSGDGFLQVAVPSRADGSDAALISHSGRISAAGGRVEMQAATARDMARNAINLSGLVEARSVSGRSGAIVLGGGEGGAVTISGRLDASARGARAATRPVKAARGGDITVTGDAIRLNGARLQADGTAGGGRIRVGGELQGGGTLQRASLTTVDAATTLSADAGRSGRGGDVVVWSDGSTAFAGTIRARGGATLGDGGAAEVSSKGLLAYAGTTDLSAAHGAFGTLLLDPYNVTISDAPSQGAGANGLTPSADNSVINAGTLATALATANVTVTTGAAGSPGAQAGDIAVQANVAWTAPTTLTLSAFNNIRVGPTDSAPAAPAGSIAVPAGGGLILRADNSGRGIGTVDFRAASIVAANPAAVSVYYNPASNPVGSGVNPTSYTAPTAYTATIVTAPGVSSVQPVAAYMLVNTAADLQNMRNALAGSYALGRDFSAQGAGFNGGVGFTPIGTAAAPFTGRLDGQGRTVSNLTVARPQQDYAGLFGSIQNGSVQNLNLTNVSVTGGSFVGGLAGQVLATVEGSASVTNVSVGGRVTGTANAAGAPSQRVGGLIGSLSADGTLADAGRARASVAGSFATAAVSAPGVGVGGLIGGVSASPRAATASVTSSYATGAVAGADAVGGLVGLASTGAPPPGNAAAAVTLDQTYATGLVVAAGAGAAGGLVGRATPAANAPITVTNSYWDTQTTGRPTSAGGTGQTTAQLQGALPAGFDAAIWRTQANAYPFLAWRFPNGVLAVSGTVLGAADPGTPVVGAPVSVQAGATAALQTQSNANGTYYVARDPLTGAGLQGVAVLAADGTQPGARPGARVQDAPVGAGAVTNADVRIDRAILSSRAASTTDFGNLLTAIAGGPSIPATTAIQNFSATLPAIYIEALNPAGFTVDQTIAVAGRLQIAGLGSGLGAATSAGPVTIVAGSALQSANSDVVVATSRFTNNAGANAIQAGAGSRTLVYSQDYANDTRGGLPGGNLYARAFGAPITEAGNQFIFTRQPVLTVTATDATREYGPTALGATRSITGLVNGDTDAQAYTGTPAVTDTTLATSGVGTYANAARIGQGTLTSPVGYTFTYLDAPLTITPAPLTITARDATKPFGTTLAFDGTEFTATGLRNGDTVTRVTLTSDGAPADAPVAGSPYAIVAGNPIGTGLLSNAPGATGVSNYRVTAIPGVLTVTQPGAPRGPTPLDVATNAPTLNRNQGTLFQPVVPRTDTLDIANLDGGGPSLGAGEPAGAKSATLAYLNVASAELDATMAACERQDGRRVKAYADCVGGALDTYASKLELRLAQLPPAFRNIPAVVRQAALKIRAARTITEARQAVRVAVVAVRKAIALIRADEPAVAQRQKREGNAIASALQSVDGRLSRSVGL